jgi:serine/threonine-protein kinase HipA
VSEVNNHDLEVWIDVSFIEKKPIKIGHLKHDRGNVRFNYNEVWLSHPKRFDIDPDLSLDNAIFHPNPAQGNFGIFLDSSPDRWGQTLMKRREAMEAKDEGRQARTLYAWDYLIGVQDQTRQGALRFKYAGTDVFLASHDLSAPPVTQLAELENVAQQLSDKNIDDLDNLRRWLRVLVAPGASLGGARPKANFTDKDGSLWIAKFPAKDDDRDIGAWEMLSYELAIRANIQMPQAKLLKLGNHYRTFAVKRFDRIDDQRIHYASAMTMLKKESSDDASYLDIAEFIMTRGAKGAIKDDLAQLFRRVVFNAAISNRDDHLRNHGFILMPTGWRLSPAFDINPNIDKAEHALNFDMGDSSANLESIIATAPYYELTQDQAKQVANEILGITRTWEAVAKNLAISRGDIEMMRAAFHTSL